jgi:hypothetical protein
VLHGFLTVHHHPDRGSDPEFSDCADWNRASYESHPIDSIEPLPDVVNEYRAVARAFLELFFFVDEFITAATDARLAVVAVAVVLDWPSTRGLTVPEIAEQLECSPATITRACARFREMANLDSAGRLGSVRPGAGSLHGDKPAAVQAQSARSMDGSSNQNARAVVLVR